jgi:hypothetical protein
MRELVTRGRNQLIIVIEARARRDERVRKGGSAAGRRYDASCVPIKQKGSGYIAQLPTQCGHLRPLFPLSSTNPDPRIAAGKLEHADAELEPRAPVAALLDSHPMLAVRSTGGSSRSSLIEP